MSRTSHIAAPTVSICGFTITEGAQNLTNRLMMYQAPFGYDKTSRAKVCLFQHAVNIPDDLSKKKKRPQIFDKA